MRARQTLLVVLATLGLFAGVVPPAHADTSTDTYIVELKSTVSASSVAPSLLGADAKVLGNIHTAIAHLTAAKAAALARNPNVRSIRKDFKVKASGQEINAPWDLDLLDSRTGTTDTTYNYPNTGTGVTVYVIDSGVIPTHSEFASAHILPGVNFVQRSIVKPTRICGPGTVDDPTIDPTDTVDQSGHGTAVTSLVVGAKNGVAKDANIVPVRILDCDGEGDGSDYIAAVDWIVANHASGTPAVVNVSLGALGTGLNVATQLLIADGITVVAAAGNDNVNACTQTPASTPDAITVAAVTPNLTEPVWPDGQSTNYGPCVDLYAPGDQVVVANWKVLTNGSALAEGTSFSAPLTSGAAAQVLADHPTWNPAQVSADLSSRASFGVITNARSVNKLLNVSPLPTEAFVKASYEDFLGRPPSDAELSFHADALARGTVSRLSYLFGLASSDEWLNVIVTDLYLDTLGRDPEPSGLAGWVKVLRERQLTVAQVAALFYGSAEFYQVRGGNTDVTWVTELYRQILHREPDPGGLAAWTNLTSSHTQGRHVIAGNFYQSLESREDRVKALYQKLLKRDPDPTGWPYWSAQVLTTGDLHLAASLASSEEYWDLAHTRF